jgi:hypothetical protein
MKLLKKFELFFIIMREVIKMASRYLNQLTKFRFNNHAGLMRMDFCGYSKYTPIKWQLRQPIIQMQSMNSAFAKFCHKQSTKKPIMRKIKIDVEKDKEQLKKAEKPKPSTNRKFNIMLCIFWFVWGLIMLIFVFKWNMLSALMMCFGFLLLAISP